MQVPSTQTGPEAGSLSSIARSTGFVMCPHPGMKAENRPASPPRTKR